MAENAGDAAAAGITENTTAPSAATDALEDAKDRAIAFAEGLALAVGQGIEVGVGEEEPDGITIAFEGEASKMLVGRGGSGLDALQYITSLVINRRSTGPRLRIIFDADDYRLRREATLVKLAGELSEQVIATGQEAVLDPLSPLERRIVHNEVAKYPGVRTYSEGMEPERYIVIAPVA